MFFVNFTTTKSQQCEIRINFTKQFGLTEFFLNKYLSFFFEISCLIETFR